MPGIWGRSNAVSSGAGVTDDDARRWAYLAEGNAKQARKRVAADVVIRDDTGHVLLVNPSYKDCWDIPGGMVEANEAPRAAAERELREELGLSITAGRLLVVDWVPPRGPWDDQLLFVFDGGTLAADRVATIHTTDDELIGFAFFAVTGGAQLLRSDVAARLGRALHALDTGATDYGERHR